MNYLAHYTRLIDRAKGMELDGYRERHHIIPRCMGGGNAKQNLVFLTAEEHYVAHQLLVKIYPGVRGLATAAVRMAKQCSGNKAYGWLRRRHAEHISRITRGRVFSAEHRSRLSLALKGNQINLGSQRTPEQRKHISDALTGKKHGPMGADARSKISAALKGTVRSPETRRKMAESKYGNKHCLGRKHTAEAIAKMSRVKRERNAARRAEIIKPVSTAQFRMDIDG